jgi:menaquinone-9 beta-reductase
MQGASAVVVGGGLAGAAFALELARNGGRVLVLESTRGAHHKVCGEFLSAETQALIDYLGLDLKAMGATRAETFRLAAGKYMVEAPLPFQGAGFSRYHLDEALLNSAEAAGAEVMRGVTVSRIEPRDGSVIVGTGARSFEGAVVALATGKHGLRQFPRTPSDMVGFKIQIRVAPSSLQLLNNVVQLVMFDGGYIGACIVEDALVTMCWVMERRVIQRMETGWHAQASKFSQQSELLGDLFTGAKPVWEKPVAVAGIPYGYLRRQTISPNVFPLGDQLAVIPSFTGDGMAIALYSGILAAQAVIDGQSAVAFQKRIIRRLRSQFRWARTINLLFEKQMLQRPGIAIAARLPSLVTWIAQSTRLKGFEDVTDADNKFRKLSA